MCSGTTQTRSGSVGAGSPSAHHSLPPLHRSLSSCWQVSSPLPYVFVNQLQHTHFRTASFDARTALLFPPLQPALFRAQQRTPWQNVTNPGLPSSGLGSMLRLWLFWGVFGQLRRLPRIAARWLEGTLTPPPKCLPVACCGCSILSSRGGVEQFRGEGRAVKAYSNFRLPLRSERLEPQPSKSPKTSQKGLGFRV